MSLAAALVASAWTAIAPNVYASAPHGFYFERHIWLRVDAPASLLVEYEINCNDHVLTAMSEVRYSGPNLTGPATEGGRRHGYPSRPRAAIPGTPEEKLVARACRAPP